MALGLEEEVMYRTHAGLATVGLWLSLAIAVPIAAQQSDNTKVKAPNQLSADTQKNDKHDLAITRDIRRAIVADKSLSTYAHNVKVITQNGEVTLKGPVRSDDERKTIEAKAVEVAGQGRVANELTVAPPKTK
jgi:osmotically-inducible protein OsmY